MFVFPLFAGHPRAGAQRGFTAIELMVVVAIVAILTALAAPSFAPLIERWRVRSAAEELSATIYFARSEAIKRGGRISIIQNGNDGWTVFFDANSNGINEASESLQNTTAPQRLTITFPAAFTIDRWGAFTPIGGSFLITPEGKSSTDSSSRLVCVGGGGRIRIEKGAGPC